MGTWQTQVCLFHVLPVLGIFLNIYLMLSPTSTFATRDFVAKLDVGPRLGGPVGPQQHL